MLTSLASSLLVLCAVQEPAAAQAGDATEDLAAVIQGIEKAESYTFTSTRKTERGDDGGGFGGGRGFGGGDPGPITGTYRKGLPMRLASGETEVYRDGDVLVRKNDEGAWEVFDPRSLFGRGGFGGGRGRGGQDEPGGAREAGGPPAFDPALFALTRTMAPHELLAGFASKTSSIEHAKEGELDVYTGALTEEAAREMGGGFGRGGRGGQGGGQGGGRGGRPGGEGGGFGGGGMTIAGTYRIEVQAGELVSASFEIERSGDFGGRSFESTTRETLTFDGVGETELEVPEEVLKHFSA